MKTKKLFLMAAMLLMSVCSFAQSKYLYIGPVEPTAENYKTIATEVTSYNDYYEYENNTGKKCHVYVLVAEDISVSYRELTMQDRCTQIEHTDVNIPGHKVVETAVGTAAGGRIGIDLGDEWKHFYLGTTQPTAANYETLTPAFSSLSEMDGATIHVPSSGKIFLLVPYSDSPSQKQLKYSFIDNEGNTVTYTEGSYDYTSIYRHYIWELSFEPGTILKYNYVTESPVTITADDKWMTYGDDLPELTYTSTWTLDGTPAISTTATKTSPVGTYPIKVEKGTLTNKYVTYVDGTLTITKAPLTVGVQNVTITEGDVIPTFTLTYSGFRNGDTESTAFTTKPVATTTAVALSKAGTYPITVSGGEAKNYALSYTQGTLTIKEKVVDPVTSGELVINGSLSDNDLSCFYARENYVEDNTIVHATIGASSGKNRTRGIKVQSTNNPPEIWNTQFFIRLPQALPAGTKYRFSFDYKASQDADVSMQSHKEPSEYIHWDFGSALFTTSWQHYEREGTITSEQSPTGNQMRTIAFNMGHISTATTYYFDNISFIINPTTGIGDVMADDSMNAAVYSLSGQKLSKPKKGINIVNGRKVVVK